MLWTRIGAELARMRREKVRVLAPLFGVLAMGVGVLASVAVSASADSSDSTNPAVQLHLDTIEGSGVSPDGTTPSGPTPDSSPNNLSATASGTPVSDGRFQRALAIGYEGYDDNGVTVADATPLRPPTGVTVMSWVRSSVSPGANRLIVGKPVPDNQCGAMSYGLGTGSGGGVQFNITADHGDNNGGIEQSSTPETTSSSIWDGNWHAVAGSYDGSTMRLWVDGVLQQTTSVVNSPPLFYDTSDPGLTDLYAGQAKSSTGCDESPFRYNGQIDEVRVYPRALSDAEIRELQSSSATNPPELGADSTSTGVNCVPGSTTTGSPTTCTATVSDTATAPEAAPTGHVAFMSDSPGTFSGPGATCTLAPAAGTTSTCHVTYTPTAVGSGLHHISAGYTSDAADSSSTGSAAVGVTPPTAPPPTTTTTTTTTSTPPPPTTPRPLASFLGPTRIRLGTQFTLNAGATRGANTLIWSVNGQPQASCPAQTPNVTLALYRQSNVTLTAIGPGGTSSTSHIVTLNGNYGPPPRGNFTRATNITTCSGGYQALDITAHGGPPAGCTTTVNAGITAAVGCLTQISDPSQVPHGEADILNGMLSSYENDPNWRADAKWYCANIANCTRQLNVHAIFGNRLIPIILTAKLYISHQTVRINGIDFRPLGGAAIAYSPGFQRVVSSSAVVTVGGVPIKVGQINLDVSNNCGSCNPAEQPIASFDSRGLPGAGDFPFTGTADISFVQNGTDRHSEIHGHVELPPSLGGITVDGVLRADNTNGIQPKSFHGHLDGIGYEDVGLTDVDIYFQAPDNWAFYGNIGIGTAEIRLTPLPEEPFNGIVFHDGSLDHAGATLDLTDDPPEIAPGVDLEKISLSFATHPTALRGTITLGALAVADVAGNMVLAFPSPSTPPFRVAPTDLPGAPAALLRQSYPTGPAIGVGGTVNVNIPDIGQVPLGGGYLLYDAPGYIAAGGEMDAGIKDLLTITGRLDGQFNVVNRRFNLSGEVQGCVEDVCGDVDAAVSSEGAGLCFGDFGGGFKWTDFPNPHLYARVSVFGIGVGTACDITEFTEDHVFATGNRARGASAARTFVVKRGRPIPEVRLDGDTGRTERDRHRPRWPVADGERGGCSPRREPHRDPVGADASDHHRREAPGAWDLHDHAVAGSGRRAQLPRHGARAGCDARARDRQRDSARAALRRLPATRGADHLLRGRARNRA